MHPGSRRRVLGYSSAIWRRATPTPASSPSSTAQPAARSPSSRISGPPPRRRSRRKRRSWRWARSSAPSGARTPSMGRSFPLAGSPGPALPWSAVPAHLEPPRTRRSQGDPHGQLLQLGLLRIAGDHHGVQHPHEGMAGKGMDPRHQAEGAVPGVMVHRGLGFEGSLAADHRPQRPGLLHLDAVSFLRQRCPADPAHAVDPAPRPLHRGSLADAGPGVPAARGHRDFRDEPAPFPPAQLHLLQKAVALSVHGKAHGACAHDQALVLLVYLHALP